MVDNVIHTAEMVCRLDDVINPDCLTCYPYRVRLENVTCLLLCESASFNMVGIVCQLYLRPVIDTSLCSRLSVHAGLSTEE